MKYEISGFICPSCQCEVDIDEIKEKKGSLGCANCLK